MTHWSVMVATTVPAPITEDQAEALADQLGEDATVGLRHEPVIEVSARFDVDAADLQAAVTVGLTRFADAMDAQGIPHTAETVEATTYEALDRELGRPAGPPKATA